ncbi:MAG: hypothetical protein ACXAC5_02940 [Promethearchaeota archaeon]|jgi:hypothetical protein
MIDLHEKETLCNIAIDQETYGSEMPALVHGQWVCPYCKFEHNDIDELAAHVATKCTDRQNGI